MKITLAVLFLAGLTIYCKCVAVLSLPPSLIAQAASLERTQESMPQQHQIAASTANSNKVAAKEDAVGITGGRGRSSAEAAALALYRNLKNLWHHQDLRLTLQKRERHTFEDDDDDDAAIDDGKSGNKELQPKQQPQRIETIKSEKSVLVPSSQSTIKPATMLASIIPQIVDVANIANAEDREQEEDEEEAARDEDSVGHEYYDLNEWLAQMPKMTDDIIVSPPLPATKQQQQHKLLQQTINNREMDLEPQDILAQIRDFNSPANVAAENKGDEGGSSIRSIGGMESHDQQQFFKPLKYWARYICRYENENDCQKEYYRALNADRMKSRTLNPFRNNQKAQPIDIESLQLALPIDNTDYYYNYNEDNYSDTPDNDDIRYINANNQSNSKPINDDDAFLLLTAEQNLIKFLTWALQELYPFRKFAKTSSTNGSDDKAADFYHPGMYIWKKLNFSGRLEPPLLVDEPGYVTVRREYNSENDDKNDLIDNEGDYKRGHSLCFFCGSDMASTKNDFSMGINSRGFSDKDDPFIPPRGRKHNLPDLGALLQRYEPFVPNRGKRDKIKDIFKYDDLFYPNRGKRDLKNIFKNNDDLFFPNRGKKQMTNAKDMPDNDSNIDNNNDNSDSDYYLQNNNYDDNDDNADDIDVLPIAMASKSGKDIKDIMVKIKRKFQQLQHLPASWPYQHHQQDGQSMLRFEKYLENEMPAIGNSNNKNDNIGNSNDNDNGNNASNNNNIITPTEMSTSFQSLKFLPKRFKPIGNILQQRNRYQQLNSYNARRQQQWGKRYGSKGSRYENNERITKNINGPARLRNAISAAAANRLPTLRSMSKQVKKQQQQKQQQQKLVALQQYPDILQKTFDNRLSSTTPLIAKFMWHNAQQHKNQASKSLVPQYDPLLWHKLQEQQLQQNLLQQPLNLLLQNQYHQPLMTMRHSQLTALQHLRNNFEQPSSLAEAAA